MVKRQRTLIIQLFAFGSTKSQRQINAANPDVRNKNTIFSALLPCQKQKPCCQDFSRLNTFFCNNFVLVLLTYFTYHVHNMVESQLKANIHNVVRVGNLRKKIISDKYKDKE